LKRKRKTSKRRRARRRGKMKRSKSNKLLRYESAAKKSEMPKVEAVRIKINIPSGKTPVSIKS